MTFESISDDPERRLFMDALGEDAGPARAAWLKRECGSDVALLRRLEALLRAHEEQTAFLPDEKDGGFDSRTERAGEHIGRYKLLQELGEGGFGVVWMAEQIEPVSRRVALKIIKMGMDTREVIARFEAERQALAMMDHPNIARVLDAGATDKGRPFFVMELVKGIPITQFCDEKQLGTRERLLLFGDVCSAINHAHQKGVIHRDIKPSNVMVTLHCDKAVPKVIDFGIAKATLGKLTDKTLFTRFEQFIGTPVYMSPEQAAMGGLDIDTRSDIYALGILLYELLTGRPPFDAKSLASAGHEEMRRIIREVEPPKPSSRLSTVAGDERNTLAKAMRAEPGKLDRLVEPDLDWIVMKAIEKDRTRRYETANGLALDIQRFLSDEPVSARPPGAGYKFRKFARRNKTALRVAAAITTVLIGATIVSSWQAVRATKAGKLATDAEKLATDRLAQVAAERDAKDEARKDAEDISNFLTEVFRSPDPSLDSRTITVAESLDKAAKKLEAGLVRQSDHRARLQAALGRTYNALGLYPEAIRMQEKFLEYSLAAFGREHSNTLLALSVLASSFQDAGRVDEALKMREEALTLSRKLNGPEHTNTLGEMTNLAISYGAAGRLAEAIKLQEEALAIKRRVLPPHDPFLVVALGSMANLYDEDGRKTEALTLREEVLKLSRDSSGPDHPDTLAAMSNLAISYLKADRPEEALKLREEALPLSRKVNGPEHPATLSAMSGLATSLADAGRLDEALRLREEVLSLRRKMNGPEHPNTLGAMTNLAISYGEAGRLTEAITLQEESLAIKRRVLAPGHRHLANALGHLADLYERSGRKAEAEALRREIADKK